MIALLLLALCFAPSFQLDPEANMTVMQIIRHWGYPVEKYDVFTKDGFILDLYRIPHGRCGSSLRSARTPILLVPGLFSSSASFVQNPPESSPAMILADAGFDVFLMNNRGCRYGLRHTQLASNESAFWKFNLDDHANYDSPAVVDKVLSITRQQSLYWIGHSQGTIVGFMFLADNPSYNSKIRTFFAISPVGTIHYAKGTTRVILKFYQFFRPLIAAYRLFSGADRFGNHPWLYRLLGHKICPPDTSRKFCKFLFRWADGPLSPTFNRSRQGVYFSHYPDATSWRTIEHYGQIAIGNEIRHFDTNPSSDIYHLKTVPYNYSNIVAPVYLFWSRNDWLTTPMEIRKVLIPRLRKGVIKGSYEVPHYSHVDFLFATDVFEKVFSPIIRIIRRTEEGNTSIIMQPPK